MSLISHPAKPMLDISRFVSSIGSDMCHVNNKKTTLYLWNNEHKQCWHCGGPLIGEVMINPFDLWCLLWLVEVWLFELVLRLSNWKLFQIQTSKRIATLDVCKYKIGARKRRKREPQIVSVALQEGHDLLLFCSVLFTCAFTSFKKRNDSCQICGNRKKRGDERKKEKTKDKVLLPLD